MKIKLGTQYINGKNYGFYCNGICGRKLDGPCNLEYNPNCNNERWLMKSVTIDGCSQLIPDIMQTVTMKTISIYYGNLSELDNDVVVKYEEETYNAILSQCEGVGEYMSDTCTIDGVQGQCYYARIDVEHCPPTLELPDYIYDYSIEDAE
jgi:hypothetical protein